MIFNAALTPFHSTASTSTLYNSLTARSTRSFGYSYVEVVDWTPGLNASTLAANVRSNVNKLYNPDGSIAAREVHAEDGSRWSRAKRWIHAGERRNGQDYSYGKNHMNPLAADWQWAVNIRVDQFVSFSSILAFRDPHIFSFLWAQVSAPVKHPLIESTLRRKNLKPPSNATTSKESLGAQGLFIHFYTNAPPTSPTTWSFAPNLIASFSILKSYIQPPQINTNFPASSPSSPNVAATRGVIPLTHALLNYTSTILPSLTPHDVLPFLTRTLNWRVQAFDDSVVANELLIGGRGRNEGDGEGPVTLEVVGRKVQKAERSDAFPTYGEWEVYGDLGLDGFRVRN